MGAKVGLTASFIALALVAGAALLLSMLIWRPAHEQEFVEHTHDEANGGNHDTGEHQHPYIIDDEHPRWPKNQGR
jgi:hypothetical protein